MVAVPTSELSPTDEFAVVAGQLNVANARLVALTERTIEVGDWDRGGHRTPTAFLAWATGLSPERAKVVVELAGKRSEYPKLVESFERGELSFEQVAVAIQAPAWAEAEIVEFARICTVGKLRRAMRENLFTGPPDEPEPEPAAVRDRLSFGPTGDGRWRIRGELGIDDGLRIEAALHERRDALFNDGNEDVTYPEAFLDCFDRSLDAVESPSRYEHYRTWLHVDVTNGAMTSTDGWRIPMALERRLVCDGVVQPVWERDGVPFSVGRTQRIVPERTRRVVERRDRGCRVPGCDAGRFVEIHHVVHWLDGGVTDTWNLIGLCPRHHKLHHEGRLGISGNADEVDGITFTDEAGQVIAPRGRPVPPTGALPQPSTPYVPALNGRFDWHWIGPWIHPLELRRRRNRWRRHDPASEGHPDAA